MRPNSGAITGQSIPQETNCTQAVPVRTAISHIGDFHWVMEGKPDHNRNDPGLGWFDSIPSQSEYPANLSCGARHKGSIMVKEIRKGTKRFKIGENGKPHASQLSSKERVKEHPTFLSGTGRGSAACPGIKVRGKPPSGVTLSEDEAGRVRATIQGEELTGILRWIGANGFTWHDAAGMCRILCIPARRNTLVSQVSAGSNHERGSTIRGDVPKLSPSVVSFVKSAIRRGAADYEFDL